MLIDLHTHTYHLSSCSSLSLADLIYRSREAGLDGICVTEHDRMWDRHELARIAQETGFLLLPGVEITTTQGHVLVYGLNEYVEDLWNLRRLREVADACGAVLVKSHPLRDGNFQARPDGRVANGLEETLRLFDAFEVLSGGESEWSNTLAKAIAESYGLKATGGSDVHALSEVGRFATRFERQIGSEADLVKELRAGRFTAVDLRPKR